MPPTNALPNCTLKIAAIASTLAGTRCKEKWLIDQKLYLARAVKVAHGTGPPDLLGTLRAGMAERDRNEKR